MQLITDTDTVVSVVQTFTFRNETINSFNRERRNKCIFAVYPKEYIPEFPFVNRSLCFMLYHHIKVMRNIITYAVNWERCEEERRYILHSQVCMCFRSGERVGKWVIISWRNMGAVYNRNREVGKPTRKNGFWQLEKGRSPVDYYQRWTIKFDLHFRCASMCEKWNMGTKEGFSQWFVE